MNIYRQIYRKIKKYDSIVIAHHIGPDPDALGSAFGLKEVILHTFSKKKVYVVGASPYKFHYLGFSDKPSEDIYKDSLLIICDTPDKKRIDGVILDEFKEVIKIDHHPFVEKFCNIEWIDDTASSASQMIIELVYKSRLKMNDKAAIKLYTGLISDTERFLYDYTTPKTFDLVSKLIKDTKIEFTKVYLPLYLRPKKDLLFQSYIMTNLIITENGFGYIKLTDEVLKEFDVDAGTAGNLINNFNYINEMIAWGFFSEDKNNNQIRGSVRSRGPIINEVLGQFNGGGHALASGVRPINFEEVDKVIEILDEQCRIYNEKKDI